MRLFKSCLGILLVFALSGCSWSHQPTISSYQPSNTEISMLNATGMTDYSMFKYDLGKNPHPKSLEFWIDLYDKGRKIDEVHRVLDFMGEKNKGRLAFILKQSDDKRSLNGNFALFSGNHFDMGMTIAIKDIGALSENLTGGSATYFNKKTTLKLDQPIVLTVKDYMMDQQTGILDKKLFTNPEVLQQLEKNNVVMVFRCQFDSETKLPK